MLICSSLLCSRTRRFKLSWRQSATQIPQRRPDGPDGFDGLFRNYRRGVGLLPGLAGFARSLEAPSKADLPSRPGGIFRFASNEPFVGWAWGEGLKVLRTMAN